MTGPQVKYRERNRKIVAAYKAGGTLREVGQAFNMTFENVRHIVKQADPELIREPYVVPGRRRKQAFPNVGLEGSKIYIVGKCRECNTPLASYTPKARDICGHCEALAEAAA